MLNVLKSLKTSLWILGTVMVTFVIGSMYIPENLEIFSEINDIPLFKWLDQNSEYLVKTYWIHIALILMAALSLNMVVCTIYELRERISLRALVQRLSPHVLHAGVLLVLFGHLVSGMTGFKNDISLQRGSEIKAQGLNIMITDMTFSEREGEDQRRWDVNTRIMSEKGIINAVIGPAKPVFVQGIGVFVKSVEESGRVLLGLVRDPGVKWEIAGAVVFLIGALGIFWSRYAIRG